MKVLAFYDRQRRAACATCTGNDPIYGCVTCGREDNSFGRHCAPCTVQQRLTDLLANQQGQVHPPLQPVFDALAAAPRPQSVLYWLTRASSRPDILTSMARGDLPISHAAFDDLPPSRAVTYIRDLLGAVGAIEPYHSGLEAVPGWLRHLLATLPSEHAEIIDRFTRWDLLRRLRLHRDQHNLPRHSVHNARSTIRAATRLLRWLDEETLQLATTGQSDLDRYLVTHSGRGAMLAGFLDWTDRAGFTTELTVPAPPRPVPEVVLSDEQRWHQVEQLLHGDTIRLQARVAGLFALLFAQPLRRTLRMRIDQITATPNGAVTVSFDTVAIELPDLVDDLVRRQLTRAQTAPANQGERWLFPGRQPGRRLTSENIRYTLVAHDIHPARARKAAMFQLAAEMPAPVLADLLGLAPVTVTRWATLAARDWSQYAAMRCAEAKPS